MWIQIELGVWTRANRRLDMYILMLNRAVGAWKSKRHNVVALSSAEAKSMAASSLVWEVIDIQGLLGYLGFQQDLATERLEKIIARASLGVRAQLEEGIGPSTSISVFIMCMMW
jgi:hypothetical protein